MLHLPTHTDALAGVAFTTTSTTQLTLTSKNNTTNPAIWTWFCEE